jgi:basic membrane lipoprotein Med (substrate-binding protein (PBP1-ABC) superfamily)
MRKCFAVQRRIWLAVAIAASATLLGCRSGGCPSASTAGDSFNAHNRFNVALLTPGPVSDAGWNAAAYEGLQLIKRQLGADVAMVQTASPADFDDAFRDFASRHFDLIFAHGFEYTDAALKGGQLFPQTMFIVTSGSGSATNVASLSFKIEEAAYVEGVLAGTLSKTGIAGAVGGIELPAIKLTFQGFRKGFLSVRPEGRILTIFTGSFDDVGAAKEAALAQISHGADFLFHDADAAGLGVFAAAREAHIYAFGLSRNQNAVMPDVVIASVITAIPEAFLKIAREVQAHEFHPGMLEFGMRDGMVRIVLNPSLEPKIPPAVLTRIKETEDKIMSGRLVVAAGP